MSRADLVPLLGTPSRVSEVLTGKRELSMSMVRELRERFHICRGFADFAGTAPGASGVGVARLV
jgi:antitoxin component HigA of HigAB toxin-antitoxin module